MVAADLESSRNIGSITEVSWYNGLDWERTWNTAQDVEDASCSQVSSSNKTKLPSRSEVDDLMCKQGQVYRLVSDMVVIQYTSRGVDLAWIHFDPNWCVL